VLRLPLGRSPVRFRLPPTIAQDTAFDDAQVRVVELQELGWPSRTQSGSMLDGFAVNDVIFGGGTTVTVTFWLTVPPTDLQVRVYVVVVEIGPVETGLVVPDSPATEHDAPVVSTQLSVVEAPAPTLSEPAVNDAIAGTGTTVTVAVSVTEAFSEFTQVSV
jgi:hypothetical protein